MKPQPGNTRLLKGLLLLAVLAQLSWQPSLRTLSLSSETVGSNGGPNAGTNNNAPPAAPADSASPAPAAPAAPPAAPVVNQQPQSPHIELPKICGMRFYVTYTEYANADGVLRTRMQIALHTGEISNFKTITIEKIGSLSTNLTNTDVKQDNDNTIALAVKRHISNCVDDSVPSVPTIGTSPNDREQAKKEKEDIKTGMSACRLNSHGNPLTEVEQNECQLRKLGDLETSDSTDFNTYNGRQKAMNKIEQVVGGTLRKSIKNRLMSKDDSKVDEGESLLQETLDTVNELTSSLNLDTFRMSRLTLGLEALRSGGETYRRSVSLEDTVKDSRNNLRDQLMQATLAVQQNPGNMLAQNQLMQIKFQIMQQEQQLMLQAQSQIGQPYGQMLAANRLGYLPSTDFSQFSMPYQQVQNDILGMLNTNQLLYGNNYPMVGSLGALGGLGTLGGGGTLGNYPGNFLQVRTNLANNLPVSYSRLSQPVTNMTTNSAVPNLTLGNLNTTYVPGQLPQGLQLGVAPH